MIKKQHAVRSFIFLWLVQPAFSQNTGIGTTTPLSKLHVFNGASGNTSPLSPMVVESNDHTYINLLSPNSKETSILFGKAENAVSGGIFYNNPANPNGFQFRTNGNINRMVLTSTGDLGIGTLTPNATLDIRRGSNTGGTASIGGTQNISYFNFGTNEDTYIRAGKNNRNVILNDITGGKVGIGVTPSYTLDINGRSRIRSGGTPGTSAGLWLNNSSNSEAAFLGMEDDTHVGLYGSASSWKFSMNTQTGALKVNGSEGQPGQVLQSNGGSSSSSWKTLGALIQTYYNYPSGYSDFEGTLTTSNEIVFSALTRTITVTTKSRLIISAGFHAYLNCFIACGTGRAFLDIRINGNEVLPNPCAGGISDIIASTNPGGYASISNFFYDVNPGTYTIEFIAQCLAGTELNLWSKYATFIVLPID